MKGDSAIHHLGAEVADLTGEVDRVDGAMSHTSTEYKWLGVAMRNLVLDVERLNMIIQAYDKDLAALNRNGGLIKSRVNALGLLRRFQFSAVRRWQDFTRRSQIERFQDRLEETGDKYSQMREGKEERISSLWELMAGQRVKENRLKLTLFVKKLRRTKKHVIWRGWTKSMTKRKKQDIEAEKEIIFNEHALRMAGKKKEEVEAMLGTFTKRMRAHKYIPAFNSWLKLVGGRKKRSFEEQLELERHRRRAAMADLDKSEIANRLRILLARLNDKLLDIVWRRWRRFVQDEKIREMRHSSRLKRLKAFLGSKLKGLKYGTFHGLVGEAKEHKKLAVMKSDKVKKAACFLDMISRTLTQRILGGMKRYRFIAKHEREEEDRLGVLLLHKQSQSLQRLKIFLAGKQHQTRYAAFRWWQDCTVHSKFGILEREIAGAQAGEISAEQECAAIKRALERSNNNAELQHKLAQILDRKAWCQTDVDGVVVEIEAARSKLAGVKEAVAEAKQGRRNDKLETSRLTEMHNKVTADKTSLEDEMELLVKNISWLSEETVYSYSSTLSKIGP
eukprot:TRINITY_DN37202_c0_g1_i2.p1 TRINITY_DN37202_c0_g1~~TRINITY_DN37202_c0_g1_i2.p1  ORF type:complete len:561 (+),score=174.77 TRINITY_DN37202_c0_g1_i2:518-2200(+)